MKSKADPAPREQLLTGYLHARGMRCTGERLRILHTALSMTEGFTPAELMERLEAEGYHVSAPTVYSNLKMMCEATVIRRGMTPGGKTCFFPYESAAPKIRLVCTACGKVKTSGIPELSRMIVRRRYWGFTAASFDLRIDGLCSRCRKAAEAARMKADRQVSAKSSHNINTRNENKSKATK